jgi:hypothetical protein
LQHCQLQHLLPRGTAGCGKLPASAPPAATSALLQLSARFENKNLALSATFFRLAILAHPQKTEKASQQLICCTFEPISVFKEIAAAPNRKKVAERARFLSLRFRIGTIGFSAMKQREQLAREGNADD